MRIPFHRRDESIDIQLTDTRKVSESGKWAQPEALLPADLYASALG
jgi:hypothetical protein